VFHRQATAPVRRRIEERQTATASLNRQTAMVGCGGETRSCSEILTGRTMVNVQAKGSQSVSIQLSEEVLAELDERVAKHLEISSNCAQASFIALKEQFDLEDGAIVEALTPMPGIGLRGETCGVVIGSLMAVGLVFGRDELSDRSGFRAVAPLARTFCERLEEEVGSTKCADILETAMGKQYDLTDRRQGMDYHRSGGLEICTAVVQKAVRIAAEIIQEKAQRGDGLRNE
jgi:C_GCAxxG_C_C family probable redox protein